MSCIGFWIRGHETFDSSLYLHPMKILAGNWKMNTLPEEGLALLDALVLGLSPERLGEVRIVVAPPMVQLSQAVERLWNVPEISVAAQTCHQQSMGAFTGEISAPMLRALDVDAVIIGHSERRNYFNETDADCAEKIRSCLNHELSPIFCVGETHQERQSGRAWEVIKNQLQTGLSQVSSEEIVDVVIAYEPVWAIGTGEVATPEQAQEMHGAIRQWLREKYHASAQNVPLLYGGSCKPSNAAELFALPDVDGGLIGGASLVAHDFLALLDALRES